MPSCEHQQDDGGAAHEQHRPHQPAVPVGFTADQHHCPAHAHHDPGHAGQGRPAQARTVHTDQAGHRRTKRRWPARVGWCSRGGRFPAESRTRPRRPPARFPTAASRRPAAGRRRAASPSAQHHSSHGDGESQRAQRQQPADLTAHLRVEHPAQAGLAAEAAGEAASAAPHALGRSVTGAEDPPQPVVADHQVPGRAVLAATDVGAVARPKVDHGDPPQGGRRQDGSRAQQTPHSRYPGAASSHEPGDGEGGDDHPGGEHFGEESAPDQEAARAQPPGRGPAFRLQRAGERVRRGHKQQDQQRVGVVVPVDSHGDGRESEDQGGDQGRALPAQRRTVRCSTSTAATPSSTCGRIRAHPCIPKILLLITCGHSAAGGLSTVTTPAGSKEPKRKFVQLCPIDFTAAE